MEEELLIVFDGDGLKIVTVNHEMTRAEVDLAHELGKPDMRDVIDCCLDMDDLGPGIVPRFGLAT